jgi:TolB-like protein
MTVAPSSAPCSAEACDLSARSAKTANRRRASRQHLPAQKRPPHYALIVVLPFVNLSNDPEQQYFAAGVTGDLVTDLSRIPDDFVISRTPPLPIEIGRSTQSRSGASSAQACDR